MNRYKYEYKYRYEYILIVWGHSLVSFLLNAPKHASRESGTCYSNTRKILFRTPRTTSYSNTRLLRSSAERTAPSAGVRTITTNHKGAIKLEIEQLSKLRLILD